jgi:hypothetical protein
MRWLIIILLFCSCHPLRHYRHVALDDFRNAAERNLLAKAANEEFPQIRDTPKVIFTGIDSTQYNAVNHAYNVLLDSLIAAYSRDTAGVLTAPTGTIDSLRIVRNFLRVYKPPAVIKTEVKEILVRNTAIENQLQTAIDNCRDEAERLADTAEVAKDRQAKTRQTNIWLWVVCGLLAAGNVYQLLNGKKLIG